MALRYVQRIEEDEDYYINNNHNTESIGNLLADIAKAKVQLAEYEARLMIKYQESTRATTYHRIISRKEQSDYGSDKKVYIVIHVEEYRMIDGKEVKSNLIYGTHKKYRYQQMTDAILYVYDLLNEYPGSIYHNNTPYGKMAI